MKVKQVSAGFILYKDGKILVLKNNMRWGFPKGHVEKDEKPLETAIRETKEETGITPNKHLPKPAITFFTIKYNWKKRKEYEEPFLKKVLLFFGNSPTFDVKLNFEHIAYKWIPLEEIGKIISKKKLPYSLEELRKNLG